MGRMTNAVINALKKSSLWNGKDGDESNIVLFSDTDTFPEPPYIIVKPEAGAVANTRQFRIIVHAAATSAPLDMLEDFVFGELDGLLLGGVQDEEGGRYNLYLNGYTDITPVGDDNTYFMERIYFAPMRSGM